MMDCKTFYHDIVIPGLQYCEEMTGIWSDAWARVSVLAIAGQESDWTHTTQLGGGPARGYWEFERLGAVAGVMTHRATDDFAKMLCKDIALPFTSTAIWSELARDSNLACSFARLLLWTDPRPLPDVGQQA